MRVKKIIPLFVVFAMVTSLLSVPAHATYGGGVGRADLWEWTYGLYQSGNTDFNPGGIYGDGVGREELAAAYSTYVSTLDRTVASSDNSIVFFHPFYSYLDSGSSASHSVSYSSFTQSIDLPGFYDTTGLTLYHKDYKGNAVGLVSSPLFLPEGQYTIPSITVTARNPYLGVLGSYCFYLSVYRYEESTDSLTELDYYRIRPTSNFLDPFNFTTNALNFYASSDYVYFVRLSFSGRVEFLDQTSGYTLSAPVQLLLNGGSAVENPPVSTRPTSISGNYGIIGDDGQLTNIGTQTIVNEGDSTYYNPVTSTTYDLSGWTYDYSTRTYDLSTTSGDTITVEYADESVNIMEGDTVYNVYYLIEQEPVDPDTCEHDYTCVNTTRPSCTGSGLDTYTCSLCGNTYTQIVAATGHTWEIKQSVTTQYDDTGELITEGYTIYECSVCGEQYKSTDGTSPPSGSGSSSGSTSTGSFWEKVGTLFGTVADGVISMIETTIGKILDALISLVEMLSEKFNAVLDAVLSLFDRVPDLFGGFTAFLAAVFPFLPEEFMDVLLLGLIAFVFAALFRYLTKGK